MILILSCKSMDMLSISICTFIVVYIVYIFSMTDPPCNSVHDVISERGPSDNS